MNEDWKDITDAMKCFARIENITDIIILGEQGSVRRITINQKGGQS